jgi:hypothetical protein
LTGVGGDLNIIDQNRGASKIHQYSVDVQRELGAGMAVTVGYTGATGRDIGFGWGTGRGRSSIWLKSEKIAELAPIPRERERIATIVTNGVLNRVRRARRMLRITEALTVPRDRKLAEGIV